MLCISGHKKSLDLAFSFHAGRDPEVISACSVVSRFCKEIWGAALPPEHRRRDVISLGTLVAGMAGYFQTHVLPPKQPSGPLSSLHKCLKLAGWEVVSPLVWRTRQGVNINTTITCPHPVLTNYRNDIRGVIINRAVVKLYMRNDSVHASDLYQEGAWLKPLHDLHNRLGVRDGRTLVAIVSNGIFTDYDFHRYGYDISPECKACGQGLATIRHMCITCPCVETRAKLALGDRLFGEILAEGEDSLKANRCPARSQHCVRSNVHTYC